MSDPDGDDGERSPDEDGDRDGSADRGDRAADLQSVVDREVDEIQERMDEIRERMETIGDQLNDRWETDPESAEATSPEDVVESLDKWETSDDPAADPVGETDAGDDPAGETDAGDDPGGDSGRGDDPGDETGVDDADGDPAANDG